VAEQRVLGEQAAARPERRDQNGQQEREQRDHHPIIADSISSESWIVFSAQTVGEGPIDTFIARDRIQKATRDRISISKTSSLQSHMSFDGVDWRRQNSAGVRRSRADTATD
jgi:hypothetical protein